MKTILLPKRTLVFVFFIASLLFSNISFGQTVLLDQADLDYAPGETVYITGFGWHPGETVILEVANLTNPNVDCGLVSPQPHVSWTTVADENGNFTASWYVNDCELGADLLLGALGETSGFTYEVFFTDAAIILTAATGGTAISANNVGGSYTTLTGPVLTESSTGDISTGTIILNVPIGFVFDTGGVAPTVIVSGDGTADKNINSVASGSTISVNVTSTALTVTISAKSNGSTPNILTFQNIRVRPTAISPLATGNITKTGTSSYSVLGGATNYGTLTEVKGASIISVTGTTSFIYNSSC